MAHSLFVLAFGLAGTRTICDIDARCSPKIRLSHLRNRVTFWLQGLNTHIRESNYACDSQPKGKTNGEWANYVGTMLLDSLDSDADASVVIVLRQ